MGKVIKYIGIFVGIVLLLSLIVLFLLAKWVNPNRLKPVIEKQVQTLTGRKLTIQGDLSWTLFPSIGVNVGHMTLDNPASFKQSTFAEIEGATVNVKLIPLLHSQIESNGVIVKGMKLNLIKKADGTVNWNFGSKAAEMNAPAAKTNTNNAAPLGVFISTIEVSDSFITVNDEATHQINKIENFNFKASDISFNKAFPVSTRFDFAANKTASGHVDMKTEMTMDLANNRYQMHDLAVKADIKQENKKIKVNVDGDVVADLKAQQIEWKPFNGKIANMSMNGEWIVTQLDKTPLIKGQINIPAFDLKALLNEINQPADALQAAKNLAGQVSVTAQGKSTTVKGRFTLDELEAAKLHINQIASNVRFQDQVLYLESLTGKLYDGQLQAQGKVDVTNPIPRIAMQSTLSHIQAGPLMDDLKGKDQKVKVTGVADFAMNITTSGTGSPAILQNLNGTSQYHFKDGVLVGVDLGYWIDNAYAFVKGKSISKENTNQTPFGSLDGTATIRNGVMNTNDMLINSPRFEVKGRGDINLVTQQIQMALDTSVKKISANDESDIKDLYGTVIPIKVTGSLSSPSIKLDTGSLASALAKRQLQDVKTKVQDQIQDKLKDKIPAEATDLIKGLLR